MGPFGMSSTQGETDPNIPDISMVEIGDGFGESETEENWDETGTPYLSCESSVVQNDIDSEDSLAVVDEAEFEGKEIADSSEKGELDGGTSTVRGGKELQDRHK